MNIRRATPGDREVVITLLRAQLDDHGIATPGLAHAADGLLGGDEHGCVLLACDGDIPVGVAVLSYVWTLEHGGASVWLDELYVVPDRRGAGIGGALLDAALAVARARGALAVDLEVDAEHERASHLYERAGFRRHRRTRFVRPLP